MMPRRPTRPDARTTGPCYPPYPTGRRLLLHIMCPCTPFSRVSPPQRVCLPVTLLWSGLLVIIFPSCPPTQREPAPVTHGRLHLHPQTPPHLRKARALHYRGRLQGRPS